MQTPRPYLSWSSMDLFEHNPEKWKRAYLYEEKNRVNRGMALGRQMAEGLERGEATGDPVLDLLMAKLPKFEIMDKEFDAELKDGKKIIIIRAKPDTMKADMSAFKEYKPGQTLWTREQVNKNGQITFYATAMFLRTGKIPQDIELVHVETAKEDKEALDARIGATGGLYRHPTSRNMVDILKMQVRMIKAWRGIERIVSEELL